MQTINRKLQNNLKENIMENIETSTTIIEIAKALCEFQMAVEKIKKTEINPFFKSSYADLSSILDVIREPLYKNGLSFVQFPLSGHVLLTMLMHKSGEWMRGSYEMTPSKNDPQGLGSVITYQRRYALGAILGLNIDEDKDGNESKTAPETENKQPWLNQSTTQWAEAVKYIAGGGKIETIKKKYKISKVNEQKLIDESIQGA